MASLFKKKDKTVIAGSFVGPLFCKENSYQQLTFAHLETDDEHALADNTMF